MSGSHACSYVLCRRFLCYTGSLRPYASMNHYQVYLIIVIINKYIYKIGIHTYIENFKPNWQKPMGFETTSHVILAKLFTFFVIVNTWIMRL